ncbi:uncharacterized protein ACLA_045450 [Aspergillus clavatus NRRL 1]|uniref:Uncharacterized protein n=1 Tax=Aspergillus clavatus (strain ATCC 1007 / CBS 513.65 / DSM 816 / NCTC 3887 / NRRL 1 / QM 1276 / 107) TaxID=344612 RepID=A1CGS5_ASPCL|nr:uncharacterized protein ACLA_045450 [Aspergillus clavatus NRRL 1]EAW10080.1 hypothetical protein ACLA_045450 [Aspergillus clavatus NRRL 1]
MDLLQQPSLYGGGGSPSSAAFPDVSPFWKNALVSATIGDEESGCDGSSTSGGGASTGRDSDKGSVTRTFARFESITALKTSDEKGGGRDETKLEEEASEHGECGGGAV